MKSGCCGLLRASGAVIGSLCLLTPALYAQKNPIKLKKAFSAKTTVPVSPVRPPLLSAAQSVPVDRLLRQGFMANWDLALSTQLERKALQAVTARRKERLQAQRLLAGQKPFSPYAQKQTQFLRDDLEKNENIWPSYFYGSKGIYVLRRIINFMEVEERSPEILEVQQEMIRLRAASKATSPLQVMERANRMLKDGIVPQRAYLWSQEIYPEEVLAMGEEIAFAIAASKVPMKDNPWNIEGMDELTDKVTTYNAMRRATPLFEGLPEQYTENGVNKPNIPVLILAEYAGRQLDFAMAHPFDYALAPYRSRYFGLALPHVFNSLSPIEKEAILFTTPGLETSTDQQISKDWYNEAESIWNIIHPDRELRSFLSKVDQADFVKRLSWAATGNYRLLFIPTRGGDKVSFKDLPYEYQVEFLHWVWKHYQLTPQTVLKILYK